MAESSAGQALPFPTSQCYEIASTTSYPNYSLLTRFEGHSARNIPNTNSVYVPPSSKEETENQE